MQWHADRNSPLSVAVGQIILDPFFWCFTIWEKEQKWAYAIKETVNIINYLSLVFSPTDSVNWVLEHQLLVV